MKSLRRIAASMLVIALAAAMLGLGTWAYFHDEEANPASVTAGEIDLVVDSENPAVSAMEIADIKPGQWVEKAFELRTPEDSNNGPVWMHFEGVLGSEGDVDFGGYSSEPEYYAAVANNIYDQITVGLTVNKTVGLTVNEVVLIPADDSVTVADLECMWIPLGFVGPDDDIEVVLSFHMKADAGNEYQGDVCSWDIEWAMHQEGMHAPGTADGITPADDAWVGLFMENKTGDPDWNVITNDGMWGSLLYKYQSDDFEYFFFGHGLEAAVDYSLIYYSDPWPGTGGALIANGAADASGDLWLVGANDIGTDIPVAADDNFASGGGKIWLVPSIDFDSTAGEMSSWYPTSILYEWNLTNYDDTDI